MDIFIICFQLKKKLLSILSIKQLSFSCLTFCNGINLKGQKPPLDPIALCLPRNQDNH